MANVLASIMVTIACSIYVIFVAILFGIYLTHYMLSNIMKVINHPKHKAYTVKELQKLEENEKELLWMNKNQQNDTPSIVLATLDDFPILHLTNETNGAEIYLIGTCHTSQKSKNEVRKVIRAIRPNYVMVEMQRDDYYDEYYIETKTLLSTIYDIANAVYSLLFENMDGKIFTILNMFGLYGKEMNVGIEEGEAVGARIVLEDDYTLDDHKEIERQLDLLFSWNQADDFEVDYLLDRRNQRWTNSLWYLKGKVVGVIGSDHLPGIQELWNKKATETRKLHSDT